MHTYILKYGFNPNQMQAKAFLESGERLPFKVLNGKAGMINLLDAFNAWQLVRQLKEVTGLPAATSFKHVSPAGAAVGLPLSNELKKAYFVEDLKLSPLAAAYARARGADRMSSYGDFVALSDECDVETATLLAREVSDGIIAPSYSKEALDILTAKRGGSYTVLQMDTNYKPHPLEERQVFGISFQQHRNEIKLSNEMFSKIVTNNKNLPDDAKLDLLIAMVTLKYTQSNSVCYAKDGQAIGIGAGQQSRIHCVRLAGDKADIWHLRQHPKVLALEFKESVRRPDRDNAVDVYISDYAEDVLADGNWEVLFTKKPEIFTADEKKDYLATITGVSLASDAFFPFGDNIERAKRSGVMYIAETGGSVRDDHVIATANKYDMVMAFTGIRLFHH